MFQLGILKKFLDKSLLNSMGRVSKTVKSFFLTSLMESMKISIESRISRMLNL